eukprot:gene10626-10697_t
MANVSSDRVESLLAAMTLAEKIGQLVMLGEEAKADDGAPFDIDAAVCSGAVGSLLNFNDRARIAEIQARARQDSRLGIPVLFTLDTVHGHWTIFPVPLAEAGAFNPQLWQDTAKLAADEARQDGIALTFAPMLDVSIDPRWGRIVEGPGEDPWLASAFARAKIAGFQGQEADGSIKAPFVAATAKHFVAYGAVTAGREYASADVSDRMLWEVYLPPFKAAVEAGVAAIMPAFTNLAGVPLTADPRLLGEILRGQWGFTGVLISDYAAVAELIAHGVATDLVEAAALALRAGVDIDMMGHAYAKGLEAALHRGLVSMDDIDASVRRVLRLKEKLGLFDDAMNAPLPELTGLHRDLAFQAAVQSIVLLKNDGDILPLKADGGPIAVIGPLVDAKLDMLGPWAAKGDPAEVSDIMASLRQSFGQRSVTYACGCDIETGSKTDHAEALALAAKADIIVLCLGESRDMSGEGGSRAYPVLPKVQENLAYDILALGKPVVLVLSSGRPVIATGVLGRIDAVLASWFSGTEAGRAIAEILSGTAAPAGRLPMSWPSDIGQIPITYREMPAGRPANDADRLTSRYLDVPVTPLYPFGHGMTYASFAIHSVVLDQVSVGRGQGVGVSLSVENSSKRAGEAVVFLFIHDPVASVSRPLLELRGANKVMIEAGATANMRFELTAEDLTFPDRNGRPLQELGQFNIFVGFSADRSRLHKVTLDVSGV